MNTVMSAAQSAYYEEPFRPQFHFSPDMGWMNDPNGLVYYEGEYHLFFQYNRDRTVWSTMHWGHAVSTDLIHWTQLPIALNPDANGAIFSGSAVVDADNSSGLVPGGGLIAIFSYQNQTQGIAYSLDKGRTWTMYSGNPILSNPGPTNDFRDPKVFWYAPKSKWLMVIAASNRIKLYDSPDLKTWTYLSDFGDFQGAHGGVWECPDLFPMSVDGRPKWVLIVSVGHGGPAGGSGTQYFVGDFDGTTFTNDNPGSTVLWLDHGADNYAGITWDNTPDTSRILIGWMNNWVYANQIPTSTWRGAMTIPRRLELRNLDGQGPRLVQSPIPALQTLREQATHWADQTIDSSVNLLAGISGSLLEIVGEFEVSNATEFGFKFQQQADQVTIVGYSQTSGNLFVDRLHAGDASFNTTFPGIMRAPLKPVNGRITLHLFVDRSSVEVFGGAGEAVITDQIFPATNHNALELYSNGGQTRLIALDVYQLKRTWPDPVQTNDKF